MDFPLSKLLIKEISLQDDHSMRHWQLFLLCFLFSSASSKIQKVERKWGNCWPHSSKSSTEAVRYNCLISISRGYSMTKFCACWSKPVSCYRSNTHSATCIETYYLIMLWRLWSDYCLLLWTSNWRGYFSFHRLPLYCGCGLCTKIRWYKMLISGSLCYWSNSQN